jgi:hypothetical protein
MVSVGVVAVIGCKSTENDLCPASMGPTTHSGTITKDEVWTAEGSPHIVTGPLTVDEGAKVTIDPCVEVQMKADASLRVGNVDNAPSRLVAEGTAERPIRFVGAGSARWEQLEVIAPSTLSLVHVTLEDGGKNADGTFHGASLVIRGNQQLPLTPVAKVDHVTVRGSVGAGVYLGEEAGFTDDSDELTIVDCGGPESPRPIWSAAHALGTIPKGHYTGNALDEIQVDLGNPSQENLTIHDRGLPYHVGGDGDAFWFFQPPDGAGPITMTIEPGVVMRMTPHLQLHIGAGSVGEPMNPAALIAAGTADRPIVLTSDAASPKAGDWVGILFKGSLPSAPNQVAHVRVEYAGDDCLASAFTCAPANTPECGAIILMSTRPDTEFVSDTVIAHSAAHGVVRGWSSDASGPDFVPGNTFDDVKYCRQTSYKTTGNDCAENPCE